METIAAGVRSWGMEPTTTLSAAALPVDPPARSGPADPGVRGALRRLHRRARRSGLLWRLVVGTRILLAVAFLPTGLVKLLGQPFSRISTDSPIGLFFHVFQTSGLYWQFLGAAQVTAAILLLLPRTRALGAALFFPIILNIFVITVSLQFGGTVAVTGPMLLAATLLVAWDWHRFEGLFFAPQDGERHRPPPSPEPALTRVERGIYGVGLVSGMTMFLASRSFFGPWVFQGSLLVAALAGLAAVGVGLWVCWRSRARS